MIDVASNTEESVYDKLKQRLNNDLKEKEILGHIINQPSDQPDIFTEVKAEYFNNQQHKNLYNTMHSMFSSGADVTYNAVCEFTEISAKEQKIAEIKATLESVKNFRVIDTLTNAITILKELHKNRQIYAEVLIRGELMFKDNEPIEKIINHMSTVLVNIETGKREKTVIEVASNVVDELLNPLLGNKGLDTGLNDFDLQFGGVRRDTYYTIGGVSGFGKTALLSDLIERLCQRHPDKIAILFYSLEMAESRIIKRVVSRKTMLTNQTLDMGLFSKDERVAIQQAGIEIKDYPLEIVYQSMDINQMHLRTRKFALEHPDKHLIVMLDHIGLVSGSTPDMRVNTILTSTMLKSWCRDYDASVFALTQFTKEADHPNRRKEFFRPSMSFIMESGRIRQDSDVVLLGWRPEMYFTDIPYQGIENWDTRNKLILLNEKNRDGQAPTDIILNCNIGCNLVANISDVF